MADSLFWAVTQKHNTLLAMWFSLIAWALFGALVLWQLTQMTMVEGVRQIPPAHLAMLPRLLEVWVGGFVTIARIAARMNDEER